MGALPSRFSRLGPVLVLTLAAAASFGAFAAVPHDGFHPLMQMACLLPLQLAALLFVLRSSRS
jgi:hypothetical protein